MKKRDYYIETMLREADIEKGPTEITIYYEDLTSEGREKILEAIDNSDELLNVFGDDMTRQSIEDSFFGNNGKDKIPLFKLDADKLRSSMEI